MNEPAVLGSPLRLPPHHRLRQGSNPGRAPAQGRTPWSASPPRRAGWWRRIALIIFAGGQIAGAIYYGSFFIENGYLPSPFLFDKFDSFMDLFNPMFWSDNGGRYTEWASIYPPLNFIILAGTKWIFVGFDRYLDAFELREAAVSVQLLLVGLHFLGPVFVLRTGLWRDYSAAEKLALYCGMVLSVPLVFALERGNLVMLSGVMLALILDSGEKTRAVLLAALINIKPYFGILLLHYVLKGRWKQLRVCLTYCGLLFVLPALMMADENVLLIFQNIFSFTGEASPSMRQVMAMPSSVSSVSYVLNSSYFDTAKYSYIPSPSTLPIIVDGLKWVVILGALSGLSFRRRELSAEQAIAILVVLITNLGISLGGYSLVTDIAIAPILLRMRFSPLYCGALLFIFAPVDIPTFLSDASVQYSYLSGQIVPVDWTLGFGTILRPIVNLILLAAIACELAFGNVSPSRSREYAIVRNATGAGRRTAPSPA